MTTIWSYVYTHIDNTPPTLSLPPNASISCVSSTNPSVTGQASATDNCGQTVSITYSDQMLSGSCAGNYTIQRLWLAVDVCGNASSSVQLISVSDQTGPVVNVCANTRTITGLSAAVITSPIYSTVLSASSYAEFSGLVNAGIATDACSGIGMVQYIDAEISTCPRVVARTWYISDMCGNSTSCVQTININYLTPPSSFTATACDSYTWIAPSSSVTYTTSGSYTRTFINAAGCDSVRTLYLTINNSTNHASSVTANGCYTWTLTGVTYTSSGSYSQTSINAAGCTHTETLNLTIIPQQVLQAKVFLQGSYDVTTGMMHDSLRKILPLQEPYSASPYNRPAITCPNLETTTNAVLATTGANAIVDWIFLELRSSTNPAIIVATRRALLQRDGDVVSADDGISAVTFPNVPAGSYYVSIKHRNHLGVMASQPMLFSNCSAVACDFTTTTLWSNVSIATLPAKVMNGVSVLWCSDANTNKNTKYNGLDNDKDKVLSAVGGSSTINTTVYGYRQEDLNMDGKIRFNGTDNDRNLILSTIGVSTPNTFIYQHTPN